MSGAQRAAVVVHPAFVPLPFERQQPAPSWRWAIGDLQGWSRLGQKVVCLGLLIEHLAVRCSEHRHVRNRIDEQALCPHLWFLAERTEQLVVSSFLHVAARMGGWQFPLHHTRQAVCRRDDVAPTRVSDEAAPIADLNDGLLCRFSVHDQARFQPRLTGTTTLLSPLPPGKLTICGHVADTLLFS